jgi:KaiC/GvpD/RAD55 family RecA-like ATPase
MPTNLEVALTYASWGWKVIPVVPNGKIPATAHGVKDATDDPDKITDWWTRNPNMNIGVAAGETSGIIVYDIDPRNGGDNSWEIWLENNGGVPDGVMALTAGGGQHYIAEYEQGVRSCKLKQGIDLLSDGRYFVAYPSTIEGRSYQWEASSDPFDGVKPFKIPPKWKDAMIDQRLDKPTSSIGGLIQGDRNNGLTSLAGAMRHLGMQENEILQAITVVNDTRCVPPLPDSEVRQIVRSVSRYSSDLDLAGDVALGSEAAEALLAAETADTDYYFTRATSFLSQPAPMEWVIKGWIPKQSISMIYGESGVGKSFIALDMACSIASGKLWQNIKTSKGTVVYLAGEGNYGIRQRIASWCIKNGVSDLDNLLISNKPLDLDAPNSAIKVIEAIRELSDGPIGILYVDTLNNHMSGDENSARDTRTMINNCKIIGAALGCTVVFVHHTGLNDSSKGRARGSSAWKGSLDSSLLISRASGDVIKVSCEKMKDSQEPLPLFGTLAYVNLGWTDEDGDEIKGAAFQIENNYVDTVKHEPKANTDMKLLTKAWFATGAELSSNGNPIINRSALADYLEREGVYGSPGSLRNQLSVKYEKGLLNTLFLADIIKVNMNGTKIKDVEVINQEFANPMRLSKDNS